MDAAAIAAQNEVVQAYIARADPRWEHIVVSFEVQPAGDALDFDNLAFAIFPTAEGYADADIRIDPDAQLRVRRLRETMARRGEAWNSFELKIDRPGTYTFDFSYDPPARMTGRFDDQSYHRFSRYTQEWATKKAAAAP